MARRKKKEEHINHERWLVSYADFITLLFAFFTSLYAISTVDARKAGKMVFSTRAAFNLDFFPTDKPVLGLSSPVDDLNRPGVHVPKEKIVPDVMRSHKRAAPTSNIKIKDVHQLFDDMHRYIDQNALSDKVSVHYARKNVVISLSEAALFGAGSADLQPASLPVLDAIAEKVQDLHIDMRVEGHTDDTPIAGSHFQSNWELSTARAISVVRYFTDEFSYAPETLSVAGFASNKPIASNDTPAGRAANRRIDIVLLGKESE